MYDLMFKATDKAAWDAFAGTFPETGILVDEIGQILITPPVLDANGNIITPVVIDEAYHVNVRIISDEVDCSILANGAPGVNWINPTTVTSPERIWAGGMNYYIKG